MTGESKANVRAGAEPRGLVPTSIDEAWRLAQALAAAGEMIPEDYRGQPAKILAAILKGLEVGLQAMQSLAYIAVIRGRPCIWGDAIQALVLRAGHSLDHRLIGSGDERMAIATLIRADGTKIERSFSVADAKIAGLWGKRGKSGEPTPWVSYPDRMLAMRARAWAARDGAADALMGLSVREELADLPEINAAVSPMEILGPPEALAIQHSDSVAPDDTAGPTSSEASTVPQNGLPSPGLLMPDGELKSAGAGALDAWTEAWVEEARTTDDTRAAEISFATAVTHAKALYRAGKALARLTEAIESVRTALAYRRDELARAVIAKNDVPA